MKKLPTDLQILNAIYERYYKTFAQYTDENITYRLTLRRLGGI